ncbi:MAG: hypothetical protein AAF493_15510 [Pseudomonadota bacterium]
MNWSAAPPPQAQPVGVFGFVYSGLDVGSALAPISIGFSLDGGEPRYALWAVAALFFLAIFTATVIRNTPDPALASP